MPEFAADLKPKLTAAMKWLRQPFMGTAETKEETAAARQQSIDDAAAKHEQLTNDPSKALIRWVAKLGAGIVGGLGLTGIVSVIGAAILYERFHEAGLPATQALAAVPEEQLLIEGAAGLIIVFLVAALAVTALFSLDRTGQITNATAIALGLLWLGGVAYAILETEVDGGTVLLLALLGLVLGGASIGIGKVTGALYVPFALAVFVSTVIFGGALNFAVAAEEDSIQPAAVLRDAKGLGLRALYIADNDEYIWIGVIRRHAVPRDSIDAVPLYRIARTPSTRLLIGKLQPFREAVDETLELRAQLRETTAPGPRLPEDVPSGSQGTGGEGSAYDGPSIFDQGQQALTETP